MTVTGSPSFVSATKGNGVLINAAADYLSVAHTSDNASSGLPIFATNGAYTVAFWVKLPAPQASTGANTLQAEFAAPSSQKFYRVQC